MPPEASIPRIAATISALVADASDRERVTPGDGKSGSMFERVQVGEDTYFLKTSSYRTDWLMRMIGDHDYRNYLVWQSGLMDQVPPSIDHAVVGMALEHHGDDALLGILMRDVSDALVPEGNEPISNGATPAFYRPPCGPFGRDVGLARHPWPHHADRPSSVLCTGDARARAGIGPVPELVQVATHGWERLAERAPDAYATIRRMHTRPAVWCRR